jgi:hypothetical protein
MVSGILVTPISRNLKRISTSIDTLQTDQPSEDQFTCPFQKESTKKHFCIIFYLKNTVSLTENAKNPGRWSIP